jgi:hypothetical protein
VESDTVQDTDATVLPPPTWDRFTPAAAPIPRLTRRQLNNVLRDLLGEDVVIPPVTLNDIQTGGFASVGASAATVSPRTAEDMEAAARLIAAQMVEPSRRERFVPCSPASVADAECARSAIDAFGRRAWRRPLTTEESARLTDLSVNAATVLEDFHEGLSYGFAAVLQSPYLLFRLEVGEAAETGNYAFTSWELASRLSFLLWNTLPDDALFAAAEDGSLMTDEGLAAQFDRMIADGRSREGILEFFRQLYDLWALDSLSKDPTVFLPMSPELGAAARQETEQFIESIIFGGESVQELVLSNRTFVDQRLATLYGIPAPSREGFGEVMLPPDAGRRGLLGQASFLALASHPTSTSPTLRGKFIRERLLCGTIPAPPADVDTSIPEPDATSPTLRQRLAVHLQNPDCAVCHSLTDPIGLAFENYDGVGQWRPTENDAAIDPSGNLDGQTFTDSWELAERIAERDEYTQCIVQNLVRYGTGLIESAAQRPANGILRAGFEEAGYEFLPLLREFVLSPAFRTAAAPVETAVEEE